MSKGWCVHRSLKIKKSQRSLQLHRLTPVSDNNLPMLVVRVGVDFTDYSEGLAPRFMSSPRTPSKPGFTLMTLSREALCKSHCETTCEATRAGSRGQKFTLFSVRKVDPMK